MIVDISTDLHARAKRLIAAGEYLPGRAHFAAVIARQAYAVAVERIANPKIESRTGRGTLLVDVAACMFRIAGEPARAEGCRMLCAEIMGVTLDDDNRIAAVSL